MDNADFLDSISDVSPRWILEQLLNSGYVSQNHIRATAKSAAPESLTDVLDIPAFLRRT
jgi:hypothetical protein